MTSPMGDSEMQHVYVCETFVISSTGGTKSVSHERKSGFQNTGVGQPKARGADSALGRLWSNTARRAAWYGTSAEKHPSWARTLGSSQGLPSGHWRKSMGSRRSLQRDHTTESTRPPGTRNILRREDQFSCNNVAVSTAGTSLALLSCKRSMVLCSQHRFSFIGANELVWRTVYSDTVSVDEALIRSSFGRCRSK